MKNQLQGKDYLPDQAEWPRLLKKENHSLLKQALVFILLFLIMQLTWQILRDDPVGHFIRGTLTVKPVVKIIHLLSPQIAATANGNQILAPGGGLVIKIGCEGVEALFILIAALLSAGMKWRVTLRSVIYGTILIYSFNQLRILLLFYTFRINKPLFQFLHVSVAPLALIAIAGLFYNHLLLKHEKNSAN